MTAKKAVELRHEGRIYRADSRETFFRWAREHRISRDDSYRIAGSEKWIPVNTHNELNMLLDPDNWWKIRMGSNTYVASDWESIVKWAKEGRLSTDVQIEGPKTPPGGILGKASPELAQYLLEPLPDDPSEIPVRLQFDGRTFLPGDIDTLRKWISQSRVPVEAEVSFHDEDWRPVTDCGYFEKELWPSEVIESARDDDSEKPEDEFEPPRTDEVSEPPITAEPHEIEERDPTDRPEELADEEETSENDFIEKDKEVIYRIRTTYGEDYLFRQPRDVLSLLKRKRIHNFDEVCHPDLPGGSMFVSEFIKAKHLTGTSTLLLSILSAVFGLIGATALVFQDQNAQWMMIGGIAALVIAFLMLVRVIWKK